jgi:myxalamid-type polyketide synthase MxaD
MAGSQNNGAGAHSGERHGHRERANADPGAEAIQAWLVGKLSAQLGIEANEIDVAEPFASYGLGSTELVSLSGELAEWLGRELPAELAYECPTIEILARRLAEPPEVGRSAVKPAQVRETSAEAIAIIGIGCRFPGASDAEAFWQLLREGVDAIREVPPERFKVDDYFDLDPAAPGKMNTRWGGFLEHVDQFDAHFFGISPREAARMDPQQRLLLEVASQALEDAGQVRERLAGTPTGVFIGISNNDYGRIQLNDFTRIDAYAGTGNALSIAANRISYVFDFRGPSMALDTACSSSLVAVHEACASLRRGESTLALAGGVNLILSPAITINFSKAGAMAPDGRCKTFDARADGYVRGEGAGIVVLKPLTKAVADGDPVYAVIRGSAINQDGRSNGLMAPNPRAQEAVLREAYRCAGVAPVDVQYVETHGTGTLLGDPIEAKALGAVFGVSREPGRPCAIGSVKTNIGHLEAAAGVAGLIKAALAIKHREIPPSLNFEEPNPHIPFDELALRVQTTLTRWPMEAPALAGVSSFGFGGTNAHVVLQEAAASRTAERPHAETGKTNSTYLLPLSARSPAALRELAQVYGGLLTRREFATSVHDLCYSASVRRSHHEYRLAVTGNSAEQLNESLAAYLREEARAGLSHGHKQSDRRRKLVFVFPGQGSQWFGMGRSLLEHDAVFRDAVERCDRAMRPYGDWSLLAELSASETARSRLNEIDVLQPALFAIQVALAALWRSWGIEPDAVVGHSMGEVAAAHVAGALSLDDAARIICRRSGLVKRTIGRGAMAAVELSLDDARRALAGFKDRVSIAASNSYASTILSGEPTALEAVLVQLRARDIFCRMVKVDFAAHSPQMDPLRAEMIEALSGIDPQPASVPIYSTVTGMATMNGSEPLFDAPYWARNLREPVLFSTAVQCLVEDGHDIFLEISAHPILLSSIRQELIHCRHEGAVLPSMRRGEEERGVMLGALGGLYTAGHEFDWRRIYPAGGRYVRLPFYPWQRERCWLEATDAVSGSQVKPFAQLATGAHHPLGRHFRSAHPAHTHFWEVILDRDAMPHLGDHRIAGIAVLPASFYIGMALTAAVEVFGSQSLLMNEIVFHKALFLPDGVTPAIQVILSPDADGAAEFYIYSRGDVARSGSDGAHSDDSWTLHASGNVRPEQDGDLASLSDRAALEEIRARCTENSSGRDYYLKLSERGIDYGPYFQRITQLWRYATEVLGELGASNEPDSIATSSSLHPAILDACIQVIGVAVPDLATSNGNRAIYMPTRIDQIRIGSRSGLPRWSHAHLRELAANSVNGDVRLLDENGRVAVEISGIRFDRLGDSDRPAAVNLDDWFYEFEWQLKDRQPGEYDSEGSATAGPCVWLIFADRGGVGESLAALINARGGRGILVTRGESYGRADGEHFCIHPERSEDLQQLLNAISVRERPLAIVHLWSLDASAPEEATVASLDAAQVLGCRSVLRLVQELSRVERDHLPRLWLITRGSQPAGIEPSPIDVAQAPLWGLGRVIAQEHPMFWGGLMDLEPGEIPLEDTAHQLWNELSNSEGEDQIAFRQGRRYAGRLVRKRRSITPEAPQRWRTDGSYLITGGLGELGLVVARWMVEQGARRLILLGRTPLPPRACWNSIAAGGRPAQRIAAIRAMEALGASVHVASVDVADEPGLRAFLDDFRAEGWPPIRGVVHAAGVLHDGLLVQLDAAALNSVLRPKMTGGWLLHRLLADAPLDFFVLFSSAGALLGQPGQGNYAAANAFLDALAHYRKAQGRPALSINWGAWSGLGFAETAGGKRLAARLALLGIKTIEPPRALEVLDRLLRQSSAQVAAVPVDWARYHEFYPAGTASLLLSELAHDQPGNSAHTSHPGADKTRITLLAAQPAERLALLQSHLRELVARVLGLPASKLDVQQPLSNLGLDSLMAVELKNRIAVDLGVNVPLVTFLSGPSVEQAAAQLLHLLTSETFVSSVDPAASVFTHVNGERKSGRIDGYRQENLDEYSDEEVNSLLTDLLAEEEVSE